MYEKGSQSLSNQVKTSEKDNTLATLVIQLPSVYEGGELVIKDKNGYNNQSIDLGKKNKRKAYAAHFVAYLADSRHELHEVESGYCLTLVYSLSWSTRKKNFKF